MDTRESLRKDINLHKDLIGAPYAFGYSGPEFYDCYGLVIEIYRRLGIYLPKQLLVSDNPKEIEDCINANKARWVETSSPKAYDVILFSIAPRFISHIGLVLDSRRFLHTMLGRNACIEYYDKIPWKNRVRGFYRWHN